MSAATEITRQYLSLARRGLIKKPSAWHVHKLARFFEVDDSFFTRDVLGPEEEDAIDERLRQALANPIVRHIALRTNELSEPAQAVVFRMVEDVYVLTAHNAGREAAPDDHNIVRTGREIDGQLSRADESRAEG